MTNSLLRRAGEQLWWITALVSGCSFVLLMKLPSLSSRVGVEEDTLTTGRTRPFVNASNLVYADNGLELALSRLNLPAYQSDDSSITFTRIQAARADSREGVVYAFIVDDDIAVDVKRRLSGSVTGLSLANSLVEAPWLAKDVFIVFIPARLVRFGEGVRIFLDMLLAGSVPEYYGEKPLIRGGFVLDTWSSSGNQLIVDVAGTNGALCNQDYSNVLFEAAKELHIPLSTKQLYESIAHQGSNGGAQYSHSVFLDYGIPALTLASIEHNSDHYKETTVLHVTQLVGKHLRSVSALHHQLHHSTSWFLYANSETDLSLGIFIPVFLGLFLPVLTSALDPSANNESIECNLGILGYTLSAPFVVGSLGLATFAQAYGISGDPSQSAITWFSNSTMAMALIVLSVSFFHAYGLRMLARRLSLSMLGWFSFQCISSLGDISDVFRIAFTKTCGLILAGLMIYNWCLATVLAIGLMPSLIVVTLFSKWPWTMYTLLSVTVTIGLSFTYLVLTRGASPVALSESLLNFSTFSTWRHAEIFFGELAGFVTSASDHGNNAATVLREFRAVNGMALPVLCAVVHPLYLLLGEYVFLHIGSRFRTLRMR